MTGRSLNGSLTLGDGRTFTSPTGTARGVGPAPLVDAATSGVAGADPATLALCFGKTDDGTARLDPGQGGRQDRRLRARRQRPGQQGAGGERRRWRGHGAGQHAIQCKHHAVRRLCDPDGTPGQYLLRRRQGVRGRNQPDRDHQRRIYRHRTARAVHGQSSRRVARCSPPAAICSSPTSSPRVRTSWPPSRRPVTAGGCSRFTQAPRCRARTSPASRRCSRRRKPSWSPMAIKSALMTTAGDVLDGGTPAPNTNPVRDLSPGGRPRQPEQRARSGPRVRPRLLRLARLPVRHDQRRQRGDLQRAERPRLLHRPERPERGVDRDRRHGRRADGEAQGDQRGRLARDVHRVGHRHERLRGHAPGPISIARGQTKSIDVSFAANRRTSTPTPAASSP